MFLFHLQQSMTCPEDIAFTMCDTIHIHLDYKSLWAIVMLNCYDIRSQNSKLNPYHACIKIMAVDWKRATETNEKRMMLVIRSYCQKVDGKLSIRWPHVVLITHIALWRSVYSKDIKLISTTNISMDNKDLCAYVAQVDKKTKFLF